MELRLARSFDEIAALHAAIAGFCQRHRVPTAVEFAVQLAVEELFTNLVKYNAGPAPIEFSLVRADDRLLLSLVDHDVEAFHPDQAPPVDTGAPLSERHAGGLGLHLVRTYLDDLQYSYRDRTLRITASKPLEAPDV